MTSVGEKRRKQKLANDIKRRAAAGRPRKEAERFPCGKIKYSETEKEAKSVAIEARARVHKLTEHIENGIDLAGYTLGRMRIDRRITQAEREAGDWYAMHMANYYGTLGMGFPSAKAQDLFAVRGHDGEESKTIQQRARDAANMFMNLDKVLRDNEDGPQVKTTVFNVCFLDMDNLRMMPEFQLSLLKRGLRSLIFAKGLAQDREIIYSEIT